MEEGLFKGGETLLLGLGKKGFKGGLWGELFGLGSLVEFFWKGVSQKGGFGGPSWGLIWPGKKFGFKRGPSKQKGSLTLFIWGEEMWGSPKGV